MLEGGKMKKYHKIQTVFKRDPETNYKTLIEGEFSLRVFDFLKYNRWIFTEKVDGVNIRVMFDGETIKFAGKTDKAQIYSGLADRLNKRFLSQLSMFKTTFESSNVCFYGEGYGAGIRKGGGNYRDDQDFVLFDVKVGDWWLRREAVNNVAKAFDLDVIPIIGSGTLLELVQKTKIGFKSLWGDFNAEGIVARPSVELKARNGDRVITKIKHRDFLEVV